MTQDEPKGLGDDFCVRLHACTGTLQQGRLLLQSARFLKAIVIIVENGHSVSRSRGDWEEGPQTVSRVKHLTRNLEALEEAGGWRTPCMLNKFEPLLRLSDEEEDEDWDIHQDDTEDSQQEVIVVTDGVHKCLLKMQVTNVTKALLSVSSICDAGHRVVFEEAGGYIEHEAIKTRTKFKREDGVYRMKVKLADGY